MSKKAQAEKLNFTPVYILGALTAAALIMMIIAFAVIV